MGNQQTAPVVRINYERAELYIDGVRQKWDKFVAEDGITTHYLADEDRPGLVTIELYVSDATIEG